MLFKDYKINEFIEDLGSDSHSPGGGSTSALVASLAGSLNSMIYSLTVDKKSFNNLSDSKKEKLIRFAEKTNEFVEVSLAIMEEDREVFTELMEAYRLPRETEEEKEFRKERIKEKTKGAMEAPLNLLRKCLEFYPNIHFAVTHGNKMLASDGGVAAILLNSAIESSILNVRVNLNSLKDEEFFKELDTELDEALMESLRNKSEILMKVNEYI